MQDEDDLYSEITCSICDGPTGLEDKDGRIDGVGFYCGSCMRKMGFDSEEFIPSCSLCKLPIFNNPLLISGVGMCDIFCERCHKILVLSGFEQ